jgi:hypothetical protein
MDAGLALGDHGCSKYALCGSQDVGDQAVAGRQLWQRRPNGQVSKSVGIGCFLQGPYLGNDSIRSQIGIQLGEWPERQAPCLYGYSSIFKPGACCLHEFS